MAVCCTLRHMSVKNVYDLLTTRVLSWGGSVWIGQENNFPSEINWTEGGSKFSEWLNSESL